MNFAQKWLRGIVFYALALLVFLFAISLEISAQTTKLDVVFGIDVTGSMGGEISTVKANALQIMNNIKALVPDSAFGVVTIVDYPHYYNSYGYENSYGSGSCGDYAYKTNLDITTNSSQVQNTLNSLYTRCGDDGPQDYVRMLYESQFLSWRDGAARIIIVFGDAPAHHPHLFSQSYGGDPGRDEVMFTADDLDYEAVVNQLRQNNIKVVSVDSGCSDLTDPYCLDTHFNFEYMASQTGGRHFLLANTSQIPNAILELIKGSITQDFLWQKISLEGATYSVFVTALEKPADPSSYLYPIYCSCDKDYEPLQITIRDSAGNVINDSDKKRRILALSRNAALFRSLASKTSDPIGILSKLGGFSTLQYTPPASFCFGLIKLGGGTDTSFGYNYPGPLRLPQEYIEGIGAASLVDWDWGWDDTLATLFCSGFSFFSIWDYTHPTGIKNYDQRKQIYKKALRHVVLQDGIDEIAEDIAREKIALLSALSTLLKAKGTVTSISLANKIDNIVAKGLAATTLKQKALYDAFSAWRFSRSEMIEISTGFAPNNYTGWSAKIAAKAGPILAAINLTLDLLQYPGALIDFLLNIALLQAHGNDILENVLQSLQSASGIDQALSAAIGEAQSELSDETFRVFAQELGRKLAEISVNVALDIVQIGLSTAAIGATGTILGAPAGLVLAAADLAISMARAAYTVLKDKLEHEELQQAVVLLSSLEGVWHGHPFQTLALGLNTGDSVSEDLINRLNWNLSTKLYKGTFVTDKMWEENSGLLKSIRSFLGDEQLRLRRQRTENLRNRLINIFMGLGDSDPDLGRLAGRQNVSGKYIGFVPGQELEYLVNLTEPRTALAGYGMKCILNSPGEIGIVDPAGRRLGTFLRDDGTGNLIAEDIAQIPGGSDTGRGTHPRKIFVPEPIPGNYEVVLTGTATGPYTLEVQVLSGDIVLSKSTSAGTFEPGVFRNGVVTLDASGGNLVLTTPIEPVARGSIIGTVTDSVTGDPIEGVRLVVDDIGVFTKSDGTFEVTNVMPGTLVIRASASGYVDYISGEITLLPGGQILHNFKMTRPLVISGGGYNYPEANYRASFSMYLAGPGIIGGWLKYYYTRTRLNLLSTSITGFSVSGNQIVVSGIGTVNGAGGYTFTATVVIGTPDSFAIVIKKSDGTVYYSAGLKNISGGDLVIQ